MADLPGLPLGGVGAALSAAGVWLSSSRRGGLVPAALSANRWVRPAQALLGCALAGQAVALFGRGMPAGEAWLAASTAVLTALTVLVPLRSVAPRATRLLIVAALLVALAAFPEVLEGPAELP